MDGKRPFAPLQVVPICSLGPRLRTDVQNVVSADEGVAVLVLELTVHILLCLLHGEVHVA